MSDAVSTTPSVDRGIPVLCAPVALVAGIWSASTLAHWTIRGFSWIVAMLSLFLAASLLIYVSALILAVFSTRIEAEYQRIAGADEPAGDELASVLRANAPHGGFDPRYWVRAWALHARDEPGFVDRRSYIFVVETGNACINTVPVLFILVMMTWQVVPAAVLGLIMSVVFYQILHGTLIHFSAALMSRGEPSSRGERSRVFDLGANAPWLVFPVAGIAVGVHLIVTGSYSFALW